MNTSFSKKRYIAEVNQKLEERYLTKKIKFVLNEQADQQQTASGSAIAPSDTASDSWPKQYSCVTVGKPINNTDGSFSYLLNKLYYHSNGLVFDPSKKERFKYMCYGNTVYDAVGNVLHKGTNPTVDSLNNPEEKVQSLHNPQEKKQSKWRVCNKGPYVKFCYGPKIKEVQGCLINIHRLSLGKRKDDGYLGGETLSALASKFPQFNTGFTDNDIATICTKPVGSASQAQDNLDPDQMGTTNNSTTWSEYDKKMAQLKSDNPNKTEAELKKQINSDIYKSVKQQYFPGVSGEEEKVY
jgi:hypothetical protein